MCATFKNAFKNVSDEQFLSMCKSGNVQGVVKAIQEGANVNAKDNKGYTALIWAVIMNRTEVVKALLKAGADVNAKDNEGFTALMRAVNDSEKFWLSDDLEDEDYIKVLNNGESHLEIVKLLLKAGADVNARNNDGTTVLMKAVLYSYGSRSDWTATVRVLLDAGADVNARTKWGTTALIFAAGYRGSRIIDVLIENGAEDLVDENGRTALMEAVIKADGYGVSRDTINTLIDAGSDVNHKDNLGRSVLYYAEKNASHIGSAILERIRELSN